VNTSPTEAGASIELPTPLPTATDRATPTPDSAWFTGEVRVYPGPLHYSGDLLTVEVALQNSDHISVDDAQVAVDGVRADVTPFVYTSPLRADVLVFRWAWDTTGKTGLHDVVVTLPRSGRTPAQKLVTHVDILPSEDRPRQELGAMRAIRNSACCKI